MDPLVYQLHTLAEHNRDGSYATQSNRLNMLTLFGEQLIQCGYAQLHVTEIKGRHINRLLALWQEQQLNPSTIRNRLSVLRWWCKKVAKIGVITQRESRVALITVTTV